MEIAAASEARIAMVSVWVHRDLIHREAVPLLLQGEGLSAVEVGARLSLPNATRSHIRRSKRCRYAGPRVGAHLHERRRGEAHRRQGWVGGVYPSAQFPARTAASDGHCAFTRAARSAGLRFAVRSLFEAMDRETTKSGARVGTSSTAEIGADARISGASIDY